LRLVAYAVIAFAIPLARLTIKMRMASGYLSASRVLAHNILLSGRVWVGVTDERGANIKATATANRPRQ